MKVQKRFFSWKKQVIEKIFPLCYNRFVSRCFEFFGKGEAYEEILGKNDEEILEQESGGNDGGVRLHPFLQLSL